MLEKLYNSFGVGQCSGGFAVTNILPRWGIASTYKIACYKDHTTLTESYGVVGFVLLQIYYPAGVMIG